MQSHPRYKRHKARHLTTKREQNQRVLVTLIIHPQSMTVTLSIQLNSGIILVTSLCPITEFEEILQTIRVRWCWVTDVPSPKSSTGSHSHGIAFGHPPTRDQYCSDQKAWDAFVSSLCTINIFFRRHRTLNHRCSLLPRPWESFLEEPDRSSIFQTGT